MKTTSEILNLLKSYKNIATSKYGLPKIGIFGSVARGEQTDESDVDICYEGKAPSFLTLDLIQTDLEKLFGAKVNMSHCEVLWKTSQGMTKCVIVGIVGTVLAIVAGIVMLRKKEV